MEIWMNVLSNPMILLTESSWPPFQGLLLVPFEDDKLSSRDKRAKWLGKMLMLAKIEGRRRADGGWDGWMASLTQWTWVWASSRRWWRTGKSGVLYAVHGVANSQTQLSDWTTTTSGSFPKDPHLIKCLREDINKNAQDLWRPTQQPLTLWGCCSL